MYIIRILYYLQFALAHLKKKWHEFENYQLGASSNGGMSFHEAPDGEIFAYFLPNTNNN